MGWSNIPNDPYFQLVFPQPGMLTPNELGRITAAMNHPATSRVKLRMLAESIRANLNPHPSNQKQENVPLLDGAKVPGMQHKYRETVLFFPTEGQFCHSFCTYCFRWAQFTSVGSGQQFQSKDAETLQRYVAQHKSTKDILFTGGDPMVMSAVLLRRYIAPLLHNPDTAHLQTIRIGTKSLAYWPYRYLTDPDAKDVLKLFEDVAKSGKHLAVQAHFSHPRELENPVVAEAIRAIRMTGAQIRCQSPLIRHVNDDPDVWAHMWELQTRLGLIPYYMFIERDTGAKSYFSVPLTAAFSLFSNAYSRLSGLARTVRGPIMSASPGKVAVVGTQAIHGEKVIVLKFFQSRDPAWLDRLFFATWNEKASWLDELDPAFGEEKWFWEEGYRGIAERGRAGEGSSGQMFG
ncbi:MAG: hypothetical protein M1840_004264 [Geoglossum simile]|nr:MAG: hypothetical protein M1840_004264 [Geoglossum simile]